MWMLYKLINALLWVLSVVTPALRFFSLRSLWLCEITGIDFCETHELTCWIRCWFRGEDGKAWDVVLWLCWSVCSVDLHHWCIWHFFLLLQFSKLKGGKSEMSFSVNFEKEFFLWSQWKSVKLSLPYLFGKINVWWEISKSQYFIFSIFVAMLEKVGLSSWVEFHCVSLFIHYFWMLWLHMCLLFIC